MLRFLRHPTLWLAVLPLAGGLTLMLLGYEWGGWLILAPVLLTVAWSVLRAPFE